MEREDKKRELLLMTCAEELEHLAVLLKAVGEADLSEEHATIVRYAHLRLMSLALEADKLCG